MKTILITGGAGYLGLNIALKLIENNCNVVIADNLKNSYIIQKEDYQFDAAIYIRDFYFAFVKITDLPTISGYSFEVIEILEPPAKSIPKLNPCNLSYSSLVKRPIFL